MESIYATIGATWLVLAVVALLAEGLLRAYRLLERQLHGGEVRRQDFLDPAYHPYINWTDRWDKAMFRYIPVGLRTFNKDNPIAVVETNSLGFRTFELQEARQDCTRIAVLGGSAAWGFGASCNSATLAGQIERILNSRGGLRGRSVQVFNLAQVNQTQTQDLITGALFFSRLKPQIVVAMNGWNELAAGITFDSKVMLDWEVFPIGELVGWEPMAVGNNSIRVARDGFIQWSSRRSLLVRLLTRNLNLGKPPLFKRSIREQVELATPLFLAHMERMQALAKGFGFRYIQVCQPNLYRKKYPVDWEVKALELYDVHRPMIGDSENREFLRNCSLYDGIEEGITISPKRYGELLNLGDIFRETAERRFHSLVHCTDTGYRDIAEVVCRKIIMEDTGQKS